MKSNWIFLVVFSLTFLQCWILSEFAHGSRVKALKITSLGGPTRLKGTQNSAEIQSLARFAVQEHNKKENALVEFKRVIGVKEQVVAGKLYYITLEVVDGGHKKVYEAKVWVKPWMNFKQLQEFKHVKDVPSVASADDGLEQGWQTVPTHDSEVQDAAKYAIKSIQQRSNSLLPYELTDIILAKAKVIEDNVVYALLLKVRRGTSEEKFRVQVNKNAEGKYYLSFVKEARI